MLRLPEEFADGREWTEANPAPPGEGWTLPWDPGAGELVAHPSHVLGPEIWLAVETWRAAKAGVLPDPGGLFDQAACLVDAWAELDAADARIAAWQDAQRRRR